MTKVEEFVYTFPGVPIFLALIILTFVPGFVNDDRVLFAVLTLCMMLATAGLFGATKKYDI